MFENMTINQQMGLVFIFLSAGLFILIIITLKTKRFFISSTTGWGWEMQKRGLDLLIRQEEHPETFKRRIYLGFAFNAILLIFGILLTVGILEFW